MLKGIATSSGIAIGKVYKLEQPEIVINEAQGDPEKELKVFNCRIEIDRLKQEKLRITDEEE